MSLEKEKCVLCDEDIKCYIHQWDDLITISGRHVNPEHVFSCVGEGWHFILDELMLELINLGWPGSLLQVKQKFGALRFYAKGIPTEGASYIRDAEIFSTQVCEICGNPGELRSNRYIQTLCDEHAGLKEQWQEKGKK